MVSISSGATITALGAIGPPNIVDLPEFAPDFPTTASFGRAFRCFERLECRAHLPGIQERLPREPFILALPERNLRTWRVRCSCAGSVYSGRALRCGIA